MHVAVDHDLRRARLPRYDELLVARSKRACTSSPATASAWPRCRSSRAARCGSTTRTSTCATTCATPRCPRPVSESELKALAGRLFAQRLDRAKPLWETRRLVDGLERRPLRARLITKTHHALVDGVSRRGHHDGAVRRRARPRRRVGAPARRVDAAPAALARRSCWPRRCWSARRARPRSCAALRRARARAAPGAERVRDALAGDRRAGVRRPQPRAAVAALNVPIGPHRRYTWVDADLDAVQGDQERAGRDGQRRRADRRGGGPRALAARPRARRPTDLVLRAMVPVSVRAEAEQGALGNRVAAMWAPLPVGIEDPVEQFASGPRGDGGTEGVRPGRRRAGADRARRLRAADDPEPGRAAAGAPALLQPRRHERPRPADPALRARPAACARCTRSSRWPATRRSASRS